MSSLQDQLLKAGLANKKQAVKARKAKNEKAKNIRKGKDVVNETEESVKAAEQARIERDKVLNAEKNAAAEARAVLAQVRQIILMNAIEERGDEEFRFTHDNVIKSLAVSETMRRQLANGLLAVVADPASVDNAHYEIIPRRVAQKIAEREPSAIICLHEPSDKADDSVPLDDEYADYKIPDDLMW